MTSGIPTSPVERLGAACVPVRVRGGALGGGSPWSGTRRSAIPRGGPAACGAGRLLAALSFVLALAGAAQAQCPALPGNAFAFLRLDQPCPSTPMVRWSTPTVLYECGYFLDPAHAIDCEAGSDQACVDLCRTAAQTWNADLAGRFSFVDAAGSTPVPFCTAGSQNVNDLDGRTSIGGSTTICGGMAFGRNVLATTLRVVTTGGPAPGRLLDSDITVNQRFAFTPEEFRATLGHEMGHVLGLDHPDDCGLEFNVLMHSTLRPSTDPCFVLVPTADDIAGAQTIYAVTMPTPVATPGTCGDVDGDGVVTDIDAVQVLRAAAVLSSGCTLGVCDVDGDGAITDIDGVNVLRGAAGLPFTSRCTP